MANYTKTEWETGDLITADRLNNIEDGIEDIVEEINNTVCAVSVSGHGLIFTSITAGE